MGRGSGPAAAQFAKLLKLLKLLRVASFGRFGALGANAGDLASTRAMFKMGVVLGRVLCAAHVLACFWHALAQYSGAALSWISHAGFSLDDPLAEQYLLSFYWTVSTMIGVGYGDVVAVTNAERAYSLVTLITGAGFFAVCVCVCVCVYVCACAQRQRSCSCFCCCF